MCEKYPPKTTEKSASTKRRKNRIRRGDDLSVESHAFWTALEQLHHDGRCADSVPNLPFDAQNYTDNGFGRCFTPDGRMVNHTNNQPVASDLSSEYGAGDAVIVIQRFNDGVAVSEQHNVILPFSGKPRFTYGDEKGSKGEGGA